MQINTYPAAWPDGTRKSMTSPFNWQTEEHRAQKEKTEREREKWQANYAKRKEREKAAALRVNKTVNLGAHGGIANALKTKTTNCVNS